MKRNILLTIAYDGASFHGWQKQPNVRTVQGYLEDTMTKLFKKVILLSGTSRTDAGVHALGQRASFKADIGAIPVKKIPLVINNALCAREGNESGRGGFAKSPIRILDAEEMHEDFHARFNCKGKEYIYRLCCGTDNASDKAGTYSLDYSLVFERNYVYHIAEDLDIEAMNEASKFLIGTHDFKSFEAAGGNPRETTVRTIYDAYVIATNDDSIGARDSSRSIEFHVKGDGFLYNMVRIITGTLVEVGQGKRKPEDMKAIIDSVDRTKAGYTAPPNGLYLAEIFY